MKKPNEYNLKIRQRKMETVAVNIPKDTLVALRQIASKRDMSEMSLLKFYIGQGLRQDLTQLYADQVLETTAQVLSRHIQSEEEVSEILREIRAAGDYSANDK